MKSGFDIAKRPSRAGGSASDGREQQVETLVEVGHAATQAVEGVHRGQGSRWRRVGWRSAGRSTPPVPPRRAAPARPRACASCWKNSAVPVATPGITENTTSRVLKSSVARSNRVPQALQLVAEGIHRRGDLGVHRVAFVEKMRTADAQATRRVGARPGSWAAARGRHRRAPLSAPARWRRARRRSRARCA